MALTCGVIIVAAGRGSRIHDTTPKQFFPLGGKPLLQHTLEAFLPFLCEEMVVVVPDNYIVQTKAILADIDMVALVVAGGARRQDSVDIGVAALKTDIIMIHDGARPFVSLDIITAVKDAACEHKAAFAAIQATDTVKVVAGHFCSHTLCRDSIYLAQTPQAFLRSLLCKALLNPCDRTDEMIVVEELGIRPYVVEGSKLNFKITTKEDLEYASFLIQQL